MSALAVLQLPTHPANLRRLEEARESTRAAGEVLQRCSGLALSPPEAVYLAVVGAGLSARAVARAVGRSHVGVIKAVRQLEDLRDNPHVDDRLSALEMELFAS